MTLSSMQRLLKPLSLLAAALGGCCSRAHRPSGRVQRAGRVIGVKNNQRRGGGKYVEIVHFFLPQCI